MGRGPAGTLPAHWELMRFKAELGCQPCLCLTGFVQGSGWLLQTFAGQTP